MVIISLLTFEPMPLSTACIGILTMPLSGMTAASKV